jgi:hypothetical protein
VWHSWLQAVRMPPLGLLGMPAAKLHTGRQVETGVLGEDAALAQCSLFSASSRGQQRHQQWPPSTPRTTWAAEA